MRKISLKATQTLNGRQWLDDEVIDFFVNDIIKKSKYANKIHAMKSTFYLQLSSGPNKNGKLRKIINTVVSNYRYERILNKRILIIPICDCFHWILFVIQIPEPSQADEQGKMQQFMYGYYYNSLDYDIDQGLIINLRNYLKFRLIFETGIDYELCIANTHLKLPKQCDSFNCGIYILHFLEKTINLLNTGSDKWLNTLLDDKIDLTENWKFDPNLKRLQLINYIEMMNKRKQLKIVITQTELKTILSDLTHNNEKPEQSGIEVI